MPEPKSPVTANISTPPALLKRYGLKAKKGLGQNFLVDLNLARKIVALAGLPQEITVVELGVGLGTLTLALSEYFKRVVGYEIDEELLKVLKEEGFFPPNVEIRKGDILRLDYLRLAQELGGPLALFGNLPYYLSSRLLYKLLEERKAFKWAVFMFQKEVADRLLAEPKSKNYGQLTVYLKLTCRIKKLITLTPGCFYPPPEVHSTVVRIEVLNPTLPHEKTLKRLLKAAFSSRRKKLAKNLTTLGLKKAEILEIFEKTGLSGDVRAEEVPPEKFLALAENIEAKAW